MDVAADALGRDALIVAAIGVQDVGQIGDLAGTDLEGEKQPIAGESKVCQLCGNFVVVGAAKHDCRSALGIVFFWESRDLDLLAARLRNTGTATARVRDIIGVGQKVVGQRAARPVRRAADWQ